MLRRLPPNGWKGGEKIANRAHRATPLLPRVPMSGPNRERAVTLLGTIERFTFRNPDTGWAVVRMRDESSGRSVTAVGPMAQLTENQRLKISGTELEHPRFGVQVKVE